MMKKIFFSATTPFATNSFLKPHILALSKTNKVYLCVNLNAYPIDPNIENHAVLIHVDFKREISPLHDIKTLYSIYRILRKEQPSSIHSIMPKSGLITMMAAWLARTPHRFHTFTGQVWANKTGIGRKLLKFLDKLIILMSTKAFTDSPSQSAFLEKENVAPKHYLSTLGKGSIAGVNTQRFNNFPQKRIETRNQYRISEDECVFLYVGRVTIDKGMHELLQAFSMIKAKNSNAKLWVVGPDEGGLTSQLQEKYKDIKDAIFWLGPTQEPEKYMTAADIFVLASSREGFGSVLIEAAACAVPSVAYKIDGVIDSVKENETGLLAEKGNIDELSQKMELLLKYKDLRIELGTNGLKRVKKYFTEEKITQEWNKLYRDQVTNRANQTTTSE